MKNDQVKSICQKPISVEQYDKAHTIVSTQDSFDYRTEFMKSGLVIRKSTPYPS